MFKRKFKRLISAVCAFAVLCAASAACTSASAASDSSADEADFEPGAVIVCLNSDVTFHGELLEGFDIVEQRCLLPSTYLLRFSEKTTESVKAAIEILSENPCVKYAEPVYYMHTCELTGDITGNGELDIDDATELQKLIAGITLCDSSALYSADFNSDGSIDVQDVTQIQKTVSGII